MKHKFTVSIGMLLSSTIANAADLPSRKASPDFVPPAVAFLWTGPYAGVNVGYGFTDRSGFDGVLGGGQLGYNVQATPLFVLGLETDFQGTDISERSGGPFSRRRRIEWFGTARGRIGVTPFAVPALFYGTGGFAYGRAQPSFGGDGVRTGWTAGGGVEWAFRPDLSAKIEYLYTDLSDEAGGWWADARRNQFHTVRAGLNYHFDLFAQTPVVAKF
ncbi:porin family protein [Methylosinus sp. H3A]|uniref:outer membrane protein n=1 Tax=Methylosinus sp. H3A TaxID=2785786 RepID=UPI0018C2E28F|nr:outer membrane protein [Methylosinus sp. H3A]MBG0807990.1 porin family protein [Methylosinus sp. H3A]